VIRALAAGDAAVLLEPADERPAALAAAITTARLPGVLDVIPGAATVLVTVEPGSWEPAELRRRLAGIVAPAGSPAAAAAGLEVPVCYDGPDLADVSALTGLAPQEVIARHQAADYQVGWLGFAPGFGYLTGLDPVLGQVPRLDTPRLAVPAGSVAIAGGLAAVYPSTSPGGWRLLGRTDVRLWDPERRPPALLTPGMRVRFRAVPELGPAADPRPRIAPQPGAPPGPAGGAPGERSVVVLQPGPLTTVQDEGRPRLGHLGVPRSGAADAASFRRANALAGNDPASGCLEVTLGRLAVRFDCDAVVAVTGAPAPLRLSTAEGGRQVPPANAAFAVTSGSVLRLGSPPAGLRSYLAVDGGFDAPEVLGSRSADLLSGLGPAPLRPGQRLPLGPRLPAGTGRRSGPVPPVPVLLASPAPDAVPIAGPGQVTELRALPGPRQDWFEPDALRTLAGSAYLVTAASNRTGLRLSGPRLNRTATTELPSEGVATGSLQISHDGQPILLLADHPVTGGYPVIAVVAAADIDRAAQLRPGQRVAFRLR
jgi:KipI family sensor histidine kinase inhibitor